METRRHRLAAIDVGTNSIHMIVAEAQPHGYRVLDKEKEMVQLGRGSLGGNPLTAEAIERGIAAIRKMGEIARRWEVDEIVAVATSAVREAPNRDAFLAETEEKTGIRVRTISGEEEADYIFRAVRAAVDFQGGTVLCIDIGGGSVELIVGTATEIFFERSEPLGALRLSQQFLTSDPPGAAALAALRRHVRSHLKKPLSRIRSLGFDLAVGTSGTIDTLAILSSSGSAQPQPAAGLRRFERAALGELIERLAVARSSDRVARFGVEPRRAESVLAGGILLEECLDALEVESMLACSAALREGIVERALDRTRDLFQTTGSVRRIAVLELAERCACDKAHASQVARLAIRIFELTTELHGLHGAERELLEYAALLHESGMHVAFQQHHKHSFYLIRHSALRGFTDEEVAVIANVARYYRKAEPADDHQNLTELTSERRSIVARLSAILRIAAALDRGRRGAVRDLFVEVERKRVIFHIVATDDASLEIESAEKRARYFGRLFQRKTMFETEEFRK